MVRPSPPTAAAAATTSTTVVTTTASAAVAETTPLLRPDVSRDDGVADKRDGGPPTSWSSAVWSPANRILLAGFLITLSFSFTQVTIIYLFRLMECDVFYGANPPYKGDGDRCSRNEIAAATATQLSFLGMTTTFCGTLNLFVAGWQSKRWGPREALLFQILVPAIRVATQILGVIVGGQEGIIIIQTTQLITILGGPAGYILVINTIAAEAVEPSQRTAVFGKLQGVLMLGRAIGYLVGGMIGDTFGIRRPFETAFFSFCLSAIYARAALPYISPETVSAGKKPMRGIKGFFEPLKVLAPQRLRLSSGQVRKHWGVFFLCCGVFIGVLATGYVPTLVQMYATAQFGFDQASNGILISSNALMRAAFLTLMFPAIIERGRKWFLHVAKKNRGQAAARQRVAGFGPSSAHSDGYGIPTEPEEFDAPTGIQGDDEPLFLENVEEEAACHFDLYFLRWSLFVDGVVTTVSAFATQGWHMYLAALLLPFGSGTAPSAKGVITEMCPPSQRADALAAVTLVENIATLSTLGLFGFVYSALTELGLAYLTFICNAAMAMLAMAVLFLSHFPPTRSELVDDAETDD